jgi:uncharacterized protein (TIGR02594 family)
MSVLKKGSKGAEVIRLQILLNGALNPHTKIVNDGDFGKATEAAVIAFQKSKGLTADGVVGPVTWKSLGVDTQKSTSVDAKEVNGPLWYQIAVAEKGVSEIAGTTHNQRIIEYHATTTLGAKTDEIPWCSSFVNWVMNQAGIKGTNNALAKSWATWGFESSFPRVGDVVVIKRKNKSSDASTGSSTGYHVGFYVFSNASIISVFGGNQGNKVKQSNFSRNRYDVIAYRRPAAYIGLPLQQKASPMLYA